MVTQAFKPLFETHDELTGTIERSDRLGYGCGSERGLAAHRTEAAEEARYSEGTKSLLARAT